MLNGEIKTPNFDAPILAWSNSTFEKNGCQNQINVLRIAANDSRKNDSLEHGRMPSPKLERASTYASTLAFS